MTTFRPTQKPPRPPSTTPPNPPPYFAAAAPLSSSLPGDAATIDEARAIEVAALLGDSVVEVKHMHNPRGGKISRVSYALLALGAAAAIAAIMAFAVAVSNARLNQQAARYHTEDLGLPLHEFRPHQISLAYDWMAFGGAASALSCFALALVRIRRERIQPGFRIGTTHDADFAADAPLGASSFPLIAPMGDDFVLNFVDGMEGEMWSGGTLTPLAALRDRGLARPSTTAPGALEMAIPQHARVRLSSGLATFLVSSVPAPRRQPSPLWVGLSTTMVAFVAASALAHLGLWALLRTIPPDPKTLVLDPGGREGRLSHLERKAVEPPIQDDPERLTDDDDDPGSPGEQMTLDSGKMGTPSSNRVAGRYTLENKRVDPQLARQQAADRARTTGIAGALQGDLFASMTGTADFSSGLDDRTVYGGMMGDEVGEMNGGFGFGVTGFGPGANGTGWGTIGAGRYGTLGWGDGTGRGYSVGSSNGGPAKRQSKLPVVHIGIATSSPGLDREIIRRYIRRKLPRIKYCYEKQLLARPGLQGTVISNFQINPSGSVLDAAARGVDDEVSSCVADVLRSIQFPKPRAGLIQVNYPFNFRPSGG